MHDQLHALAKHLSDAAAGLGADNVAALAGKLANSPEARIGAEVARLNAEMLAVATRAADLADKMKAGIPADTGSESDTVDYLAPSARLKVHTPNDKTVLVRPGETVKFVDPTGLFVVEITGR